MLRHPAPSLDHARASEADADAEAAEATGLSVHTIEKYLVEARARLRVIMKEL